MRVKFPRPLLLGTVGVGKGMIHYFLKKVVMPLPVMPLP
jgi:hypothetical protein